METYIYRHHDESLCGIVLSKEGKKFIDNVERFCTNWEYLIDEAKSGFAGFPFYEETGNYDIGFWDKYLEIFEGCNEDYELLLGTYNGEIVVDSEPLENKGEYFDTLFDVMKIAERYDFNTLLDVIYRKDYIVLSSKTTLLVCTNTKIPFEPNNEQKILRETIRKRLKSLDSFGEQVLYAKYEHRNEKETPESYRDYVPHQVNIKKDSLVNKIFKTEVLYGCPSWHHQAVLGVEDTKLLVTASTNTNSEEIIEAIEFKDKNFIVELQFHPEAAVVKHMNNVENASEFMDTETALLIFEELLSCVR